MGAIVLLVATVVEAAYAGYCLITGSEHKRVRSYVRIGALAVFMLCVLAAIIRWNFTWYLLAALLFLWAAVVNLDADLAGEYVDVVDGRRVLNAGVYPVPILTFLSEDLQQRIAAIPNAGEVVALQHVVATAPHAYEIVVPGTNHMSFTDLALASPALSSLLNRSVHSTRGAGADPLVTLERLNATVLQFFNAYLKGAGSFSVSG